MPGNIFKKQKNSANTASSAIKNDKNVITADNINAFEEINNAFSENFVAPDQNVLELDTPISRKIAKKIKKRNNINDLKGENATADTLENKADIEAILEKQVNTWLSENAPAIIRKALNAKIDGMKNDR